MVNYKKVVDGLDKAIFKEMYAKYGNGGYDHLLDDALKGTFNNKTLTKI